MESLASLAIYTNTQDHWRALLSTAHTGSNKTEMLPKPSLHMSLLFFFPSPDLPPFSRIWGVEREEDRMDCFLNDGRQTDYQSYTRHQSNQRGTCAG